MLDTLLNLGAPGQINGNIIPHSVTEVIVKEQVQPILIDKFIVDNTEIVIQCLRINKSLVLSLSKNNNQPKTLIFMVHLLSHNHLHGKIVGK